ncbi:zinc finger BED domain-containing protein 5-like [Octopus sinensis]|uniref:Zinc finger BED domain-containing protein 5-like n=1 Tax=Octopus sinensis TaxID=2607531 RepID=A0A6P7TRW5_9MOLL|nr:zinc finger BED domain-containing protein 5-like [Octopus sinensis]
MKNNLYSLQIDESTDVAGIAQLLIYIRTEKSESIIEQFLFCKALVTTTRAIDMYNLIFDYFNQHNISFKIVFPKITDKAMRIILQFATTYLCEKGFSALQNIKTNKRENLLDLDSEMRLALSNIEPDIEKLSADSLFDGMKNKQEISNCIKELQLSKQSIVRRAESISENLLSQLKKDLYACSCFSLQFDESNDAIDIAHLCVFSRLIFHDLTVKEELFAIIPMKERTTGENIYNSFKTFLLSFELLPLMKKLVSITTDGALAMIGNQNGFIAFCRKDEHFPKFLSYHCIIHQHALCGKMLNFNYVMETTVKIINSIRAKPLQRRLFRLFLEQVDAIYGDLPLHCDIRWLSKGLILSRFRELLSYIKEFSKENNKNWHFLENPDWLINLAFLTDITSN